MKFTGDVAVVKPESIAGNAEASEAFDKAIQAAVDAYHALLEAGVPAEDARYLLPNAAESKIVITTSSACAAATALNGRSATWRIACWSWRAPQLRSSSPTPVRRACVVRARRVR